MPTILFTKTGYQSWIVPSDWNNGNNLFEAIGGGAGGVTLPTGGGGGSYTQSTNITCTPGQIVYIFVGKGGVTPPADIDGVDGQDTWINVVANTPPASVAQGTHAGPGRGGKGSGVPGSPGLPVIGTFGANGGWGSGVDRDVGGAGGGAGGPHGPGANGFVNQLTGLATGGVGDAGFGGAGGITTFNYSSINNGQNGANNGSGGGGAHDGTGFTYIGRSLGYGGVGGLYGGGGGSSVGGSTGAQGIAKITYTPYVAPANTPAIVVVNTVPSQPAPSCVPNGFATATPAEIYWAYGQWNDQFNNVSSAHFDTNYKTLLALAADNDSLAYDIDYANIFNWNFVNEKENFYVDFPRQWKSRSNEWVDDGGIKSVWMRHRTIVGDADCVPNIDAPSGYATLLSNMLYIDEQTFGYRLGYSNNTGIFKPGDIVTQQFDANTNVFGTVYMMDPNYIYVNIPVGGFFPGFNVMNMFNSAVNAYVTTSTEMNEKFSANVFPGQSRYICKSTLLAQDSENLQVFMTAYRPGNSNFKVYGKVIHSADSNKYADQIWSRLVESNTTSSSFSSLTNTKDYISIQMNLPISQLLFGNMQSCSCSNTSLNVTVVAVDQFAAGDYIYLSSPGQGTFNVRQIINIPNNSTLAISALPSFSNTSNLNIGIIPHLEHPTAAFQYDQNSNVVRYVTKNDVAFDLFNQFAIKVVPISDNPVVCPTVTEFRAVASQATQ